MLLVYASTGVPQCMNCNKTILWRFCNILELMFACCSRRFMQIHSQARTAAQYQRSSSVTCPCQLPRESGLVRKHPVNTCLEWIAESRVHASGCQRQCMPGQHANFGESQPGCTAFGMQSHKSWHTGSAPYGLQIQIRPIKV